ncbi:MAG: hypothetical protein IJJ70_00720 [Treponema sp.]|nr:hypothetical protein [Treponema sp.]MBR0486214.1 hypothetical protein [Treponema sp.]
MKKNLIFAVLLLGAAMLFAENYEVKSVSGKVTYESAPGKWSEVKKGQKLSDSTVLNTSVNSKLVLVTEDNTTVTVKAMQKGTAESLVKANASVAKGLKKNPASTIAKKSAAGAVTENSKGVATASSRASEAKEDIEIDE